MTETQIDVRAELEEFDWPHARWSHDKLIAASPFRYDRSPSFFVRLEPYGDLPAGVWSDSGAFDDEWRSGTITKLLAFLRNETEAETDYYLASKYGFDIEREVIVLKTPNFRLYNSRNYLPPTTVEPCVSPYLLSRGISAEVQELAGTGKSAHKGFTAIPWYTPNGHIANVKYRSTRGKAFFYEKGAWPIGELVYGANMVKAQAETLVICEAEIDALSWWTAGIPAIAVGGVAFSDKQADIVRRLPFETLLLAGDNDRAGQAFNERIRRKMGGVFMRKLGYEGIAQKDANAIVTTQGPETLRSLAVGATRILR